MPTKHRAKLWGKIERIVGSKTTRYGSEKYQVKLVGVDKLIWVLGKELSKGVLESHKSGSTLAKTAKALVDRGYVTEQRNFLTQQARTQFIH